MSAMNIYKITDLKFLPNKRNIKVDRGIKILHWQTIYSKFQLSRLYHHLSWQSTMRKKNEIGSHEEEESNRDRVQERKRGTKGSFRTHESRLRGARLLDN